MSYVTQVTLTTADDVTSQLRADTASPQETAIRLATYMDKAALGNAFCAMDLQTSGQTALVAASGTLTLSSVVNDDTAVVGTETFTAKAVPVGNNQFSSATSDTARAAALAAKIAAHPNLAGVVTATSSLGVCTVTALVKGKIGNMITLTGSAHITASAATLAGGINATATVMHLGA